MKQEMTRITLHMHQGQVQGVLFRCVASDTISSRGAQRVYPNRACMSVQVCMQLPIQQSGICNAIAFWFELDLDEQTQLSTSPYCEKVFL